MSYQVVAPLVIAKDQDGRLHHVYEGGVISWLSPEQEAHFVDSGLVVKVGGAQPAAGPDDDEVSDADEALDKPKQAAPKASWVEYAVNGAPEDERISEDEAEAMTKAELVERFG